MGHFEDLAIGLLIILNLTITDPSPANIQQWQDLASLNFDFEVGQVVCSGVANVQDSNFLALILGLQKQPVA